MKRVHRDFVELIDHNLLLYSRRLALFSLLEHVRSRHNRSSTTASRSVDHRRRYHMRAYKVLDLRQWKALKAEGDAAAFDLHHPSSGILFVASVALHWGEGRSSVGSGSFIDSQSVE